MPFYEYQCGACQAHHEELQRITDRPLRKCPSCGKSALKRLVSAPVFRLKGGGWYETDFKADKEGKRNLAGDKEPAPPEPASTDAAAKAPADATVKEDKAAPKTDTKPAAADTSKPGKPAGTKVPSTTPKPKSPLRGARALARRRSRR